MIKYSVKFESSYFAAGTKSNLGKYGYSRDHRPDKLQITVGVRSWNEIT